MALVRSLISVLSEALWQLTWFANVIGFITLMAIEIYHRRYNKHYKVQTLRRSIGEDLHDQIGSTLSSIIIYSNVAKIYQEQQKNDELKHVLNIISETAGETISEMSDIVWAVDPKNDHMDCLLKKTYKYAHPLCLSQNINFTLICDSQTSALTLEMNIRKNLFFLLKESLNNAIKHSLCTNLSVNIWLSGDHINLQIQDDGIGFNINQPTIEDISIKTGNGLVNIKSRAKQLNARLKIESEANKGTKLNLVFRSYN